MDVTPQLLHDVEFREAKRGGYNTQDVDEFLERVAVGLERQEAQVREIRQRAELAEARALEAERRAVQAEQSASDTSTSDETITRTLVLAQRTADAAIKEAEEQAARTLSAAEEQAARLLGEAEEVSTRARAAAAEEARQAHEDTRARLLEEMQVLEATRDQLQIDVDVLERHLEDQRGRVREAVHELQRMIDDPESLRAVEPPAVSDARAPQPAAAPPEEAPTTWAPDEAAWGESEEVGGAEEDWDRHPGADTRPVEALPEADADEDAYLAELRKAMTDETPLGPRDDAGDVDLFDTGAEVTRSRFGRRRSG